MKLTPMMRQYMEMKEKYNDCILFYRVGDFYEMFFEDAKLAARELELVLTGKDCGLEERAPMSGIPHHAALNYIQRLVSKGHKVAICEQIEDPALAKGLVKRDVIKVITPGTFVENTDSDTQNLNTYLAVITVDDGFYGIAYSDISTGEFKTTYFKEIKSSLINEITKISPKEIILDTNFDEIFKKELVSYTNAVITEKDFSSFVISDSKFLDKFSEISIKDMNKASLIACKVLLKYIFETQKMSLTNINFLEEYDTVNYMSIDSNSRRNLELTESIKDKSKKGSLLWVLDKTSTSMGGRTLRRVIEEPLIVKSEIERRLEGVDELYKNVSLNENLREILRDIYDIERIVGKVANANVNGKDLVSLKASLEKVPLVKNEIKNVKSIILKDYYNDLDELDDIKELLQNGIKDDPSLSVKDGNIIKDGFNETVDELRKAKSHGKEWIASLESKEREVTGIKSLKVGYNKVFGYYIEISKANYDMIPEGRYIRKQTLTNAERYITPELKEMENKILGAEEKLTNLEYQLFVDIRNKVENEIPRLKNTAKIIGQLDVLSTLAVVALENNYVKPAINENGTITIKDGRHPVVEKVLENGEFVSNDTVLNRNDNRVLLITGPNMAGKSTYMRQVALITLMAQIGSFVPAKSADISVCDKIFTRIGASDDLAGGKSTFMVEMWEVSNILKNATSNSLVLLDEVGRGTSTYDGLSIAWSVVEYIANNVKLKCKTLFATHYHELTRLEGKIDGVKNYSVAVKEKEGNIIFLRKIVEGGADQSYGIEVAKLAGLPKDVIDRAKQILIKLENEKSDIDEDYILDSSSDSNVSVKCDDHDISKTIKNEMEPKAEIKIQSGNDVNMPDEPVQIDFSYIEKENLINKLKSMEVINLTPMQAMNALYELYNQAKNL